MNYSRNFISKAAGVLALLLSFSSFSEEYEITPYVGQMWAGDLNSSDGGTELSVSNDVHVGFAFAWQDSLSGQGQVLVNYVSHDFDSGIDGQENSIDILYTHLNGVAMFRQESYVTTVSLGLGGAYIDTDNGDGLYPSLTAAVGTRYEFSGNLAMVTELRGYMTLTDEDNDIFCNEGACTAEFDRTLWIETTISIGLAYKF